MNELRSFSELLWMALTHPRTGVLLALLVTAAWIDIRSYRIPNWLTAGGLVAGLALSTWSASSPGHAVAFAFAGAAAGLAALLPLYLLRLLGAGDVKLMATVGAFLGFPGTLYGLLFVLVGGGVVAVVYALWRRAGFRLLANVQRTVTAFAVAVVGGFRPSAGSEFRTVGRMPYAVGICLGTTAYVLVREAAWLH